MPEPITLTTLAVNIGCGIAGNAMQAGGVSGYRRIAGILRSGTPAETRDILRATHRAYVGTMKVMAGAAAKVASTPEEKAAAGKLKALCGDRAFRDFRPDGEHLPFDEVNAALDRMFSAGLNGAGPPTDSNAVFSRAVGTDLAAWGVSLPPLLDTLFVEGVGAHDPWHSVFRAKFAEQLASDQGAFRILTIERLGELRSMGLDLAAGVEALRVTLGEIAHATTDASATLSALASDLGPGLKAALAAIERREKDRDGDLAAAKKENERLKSEKLQLVRQVAELKSVIVSIRSIANAISEEDGE